MYGNEVGLEQLQNDETRNKLKLDLKLYGFDLTLETMEKLLTVDEQPVVFSNNLTGYSSEEVQLIACKKIFCNHRGTLNLVIWRNGKFSIFNREAKPASMPKINVSYSYKGNEIWDDLKEGMYVAFSHIYWNSENKIGALTDCTTRAEAERWVALYSTCLKKIEDHNSFEEIRICSSLEGKGILTTQELIDWEAQIDKTIIEIQKLENQEVVDKANALKTRITISGATMTIKGLDDHTYSIQVPKGIPWSAEDWSNFVYRHRYFWKHFDQQAVKDQTLFNEVIQKLVTTPLDWFKLSVDSKKAVKITIKNIKNKNGQDVTIAYLNDKRVAYDEMISAVHKYFMEGQTLQNPAEQPEDLDEAEKQKALEVRKQRDNTIITSGITGYINDLEGETPITIGFEKIGVNWHLTIGEKKILLRGGIETIKSLERVLKGTAQGYQARHSTEELYQRLTKVLDSETAIEIITEAKTMGKLLKALETKNIKS